MFRNLIVPCARRSQGEKSNWMRSCLLAVGSFLAPWGSVLCSEVLEIFSEPDQMSPPPGRPSDPPSRVHFDFFRTLSSVFGHVLWHFSFSTLQEVCLYCCLIFPANLWAPKDRATTASSLSRAWKRTRRLSVCVKELLRSHQCYDLTLLILLPESLFIMKQSFLCVPFSLPHVNFLRIENMYNWFWEPHWPEHNLSYTRYLLDAWISESASQ